MVNAISHSSSSGLHRWRSAYMSSATIFTGIHGMTRLSAGAKLGLMSLLIAAATLIAILTQHRFDVYFGDMLGADLAWVPGLIVPAMLYVLVERGALPTTQRLLSE